MPPAEVMDRLSITLLHILNGNLAVEQEYRALLEEAKRLNPTLGLFIKLFSYNRAIWGLEADIRNGKENEMPMAQIGERALQIRNLNRGRVEAKNEIANALGGYQIVKVQHASA